MEGLSVTEILKVRDLDTRMAERRRGSAAVRDLRRPDEDTGASDNPFLSPLGWLGAVLLNMALVLLVGLSAVLVPPLLACREQGARGFFAGDTFQTCAVRGIGARFRDLDGRLRRVILHSGQ
ncbi:hypothetical protein ASF57_09450 [Methylobacterium sp. Leaf117]|nr:hypothetical protein ASF57_09450 [Methylobacterium sp. Leaf117]